MLCVRIEGQEVEMTPALLATLVLDGRADRESPVKLPDGPVEGTLEQSLPSSYGEALTGELHRRLQRLGTMDFSGVDVAQLRTRVESLCQWRWANPPLAARFFWTAGWLNELGDRTKTAVNYYDAFLLMPAQEAHLRLLALNNRGVLRIRLGRRDGVADLARAATGITEASGFRPEAGGAGVSKRDDSRLVGLPIAASRAWGPGSLHSLQPTAYSPSLSVACFNLLNLINVSFDTVDLLRAVDEELMDFFSELAAQPRASWLGPPSGPEEDRENLEKNSGTSPAGAEPVPPILRDPTYRRLNTLVARLAAGVQTRDFASGPKAVGPASMLFRQLSLWDCRLPDDPSGPAGVGHDEAQDAPNGRGGSPHPVSRVGEPGPEPHPTRRVALGDPHQRYAEAGSLLLSDDIPLALTKAENPLVQVERAAEEELAAIESHLAAGRYELAEARLQVQRRILASLSGHGGPGSPTHESAWGSPSVTALRARVDAQIERVAHLEAQEEQRKLQRTCAGFVSEVEQFCGLDDLAQAEQRLEELRLRLHQFQAGLTPSTGAKGRGVPEVTGLLEELTARCRAHLQELQRRQIEHKIGAALQHVRENWPVDASVPAPDSVRQALAQCRRHDPEGRVEDWAALDQRLDVHQGRYHTHRALRTLQEHPEAWPQAQDELVEALSCDPEAWLTVAPLFGPKTMDQAGQILAGVLPRLAADAAKCVRLWECVAETLAPALAGRDAEALAAATALARKCRDHWPAGGAEKGPFHFFARGPDGAGETEGKSSMSPFPLRGDPRHPVNRFLEACEKARRLAEAEQWLEAQPPQVHRAQKHLADLLEAGLDTRDQLRRAVTGLYLARFREKDPPGRQRQVLAALEDWVTTAAPEEVTRRHRQEVTAEMERIRGVEEKQRQK